MPVLEYLFQDEVDAPSTCRPCQCLHNIRWHEDDEGGAPECNFLGCKCKQFIGQERRGRLCF